MYQEQINEYMATHPVFFIDEIQNFLTIPNTKKPTFNTELSRIEKKGGVKRLAHGIYVVPQQSCFGTSFPNEHIIARHVYIEKGDGYLTGPSFLNQIGVSTWLPQKTYLKVNNAKKDIGLKSFHIDASRVRISEDNKRYLQLLDGIADLQKYATDSKNINGMFYEHIRKTELNTTKLLLIGHKHYSRPVQEKLYEILEGYYEIT